MWHEYFHNRAKGKGIIVKGTKLYVAFQNISINIFCHHIFLFHGSKM